MKQLASPLKRSFYSHDHFCFLVCVYETVFVTRILRTNLLPCLSWKFTNTAQLTAIKIQELCNCFLLLSGTITFIILSYTFVD
jgi:hypothetical protein